MIHYRSGALYGLYGYELIGWINRWPALFCPWYPRSSVTKAGLSIDLFRSVARCSSINIAYTGRVLHVSIFSGMFSIHIDQDRLNPLRETIFCAFSMVFNDPINLYRMTKRIREISYIVVIGKTDWQYIRLQMNHVLLWILYFMMNLLEINTRKYLNRVWRSAHKRKT